MATPTPPTSSEAFDGAGELGRYLKDERAADKVQLSTAEDGESHGGAGAHGNGVLSVGATACWPQMTPR